MFRKQRPEPFYSLTEDFDLIIASFQQQYGIRLSKDLREMKGPEFVALLKGLDSKTPLGRVVSVRAEEDREIIKNFSSYEKKIHTEWKRKRAKKVGQDEINAVLEGLKNAFVSMAGDNQEER